MSDNWFREIELQKVFSLSPGEAQCKVAVENGMKTSEIATISEISPNTVRTMLKRGADKMKKSQNMSVMAVAVGDPMVEGMLQKRNALRVLFKCAEKAGYGVQSETPTIFALKEIDPSWVGNTTWMKDVMFRKVDLIGAQSEKDAEARAQRFGELYKELDQGKNAFGMGILVYYLTNNWMLKYEML